MSANSSGVHRLCYGANHWLSLQLQPGQLVKELLAPAACEDIAGAVREQLASPLDFPPLELAIVPDDPIVVALDRGTPNAATILSVLWEVFERRAVNPQDVLILQPASWKAGGLPDPRSELPETVRQMMRWQVHDATDPNRMAYLANSAGGERIYLARELIDAGFVLPIGSVEFDPLLGIRSAASTIFPGMSNVDAIAKSRGQEHSELSPSDDRPLRQLQEEVSWLLGIQAGIQVLPASHGRAAGVIIGELQSTWAAARQWLQRHWLVELPERCELVVAAVDDAVGGWDSIGTALQAARALVQRGGKIVLLTQAQAELTDGLQVIRQCESPREALKPLRLESPPDVIPATRLASAADWAHVYLLSPLNADVVESLFLTPLGSVDEAARLIQQCSSCVLLPAAQHCFGYVR